MKGCRIYMRKVRWLFFLHVLFLVHALAGVCGKIAATHSWDSVVFWEIYCGMIAILATYAIGWQRVLQHVPLSMAYSHRAITALWGLIFGCFFFDEAITLGKAVGLIIVMCGLILFYMDWQTNDA